MLPLKLTVLGASGARPYVNAPSAAVHIRHGGTCVLIDCGEGTQLQLERLKLSPMKLDGVCITHMHGDHIYGLPGLLTSMALSQRRKPILLIGPADLKPYLDSVFAYSSAHISFEINFIEVDPITQSDFSAVFKGLSLYTIPLHHRIPATGYYISTQEEKLKLRPGVVEKYQLPFSQIPAIKNGKDYKSSAGVLVPNHLLTVVGMKPRALAYLTDTSLLKEWPEPLMSPDVLIHDATFSSSDIELAEKTGHSTVDQAAAFAKTCHAKRLLLTHVSRRYKNLSPLLEEAKEKFLNTDWAEPGMSLEL